MTRTTTRKPRRMAREKQPQADATMTGEDVITPGKVPSRLDQLEALLTREDGATIAEMVGATGWQQHSVRGAMAGALKKRGLAISSVKIDGTRRYHGAMPA